MEKFITLSELSRRINITHANIYKYCQKGAPYKLIEYGKPYKNGNYKKRRMFKESEFLEWLKKENNKTIFAIKSVKENNKNRQKKFFSLTPSEHIIVRRFVKELRKATDSGSKDFSNFEKMLREYLG